MKDDEGLWRYWFIEPGTWVLRCIFQPAGFQKRLAYEHITTRMFVMLRMMPSVFCIAFPLVLCMRIVIYLCAPAIYSLYAIHADTILQPGMLLFVRDTLLIVLASIFLAGLLGSLFGMVYGVGFSLASAIVNGITLNNSDLGVIAMALGMTFGCILGLIFNTADIDRRNSLSKSVLWIIGGIVVGGALGVLVGLIEGYWVGNVLRSFTGFSPRINYRFLGNLTGMIIGGVSAALLAQLVGNLLRGSIRQYRGGLETGIRVALGVSGALGASLGRLAGLFNPLHQDFYSWLLSSGRFDLQVVSTFVVCYIISYFRLPLYPLDSLSMLKAYLDSKRQPEHIFYHMHHCALYCDEIVYLPLPCVKHLLLLAAKQNSRQAFEEIDFLLLEHSQQRRAVQAAVLEIVIFDLRQRESLRDISQVYLYLQGMLPQELRLLDPPVARLFHYIEDASRDAASYYVRVDGQARFDALNSMRTNLKKAHAERILRDGIVSRYLEEVIQKWHAVAKHEQENAMRTASLFGRIENPYTPGLVLELHDPLFVGRGELARQLGAALQDGKRPTFFLSGERRMGKSSILKQLPTLLGSHYLPIFYDLQRTGIVSGTAALLAAIAEGIYEQLMTRGMFARKLEYEQLREDQRENEAVVYHRFDRWLREVEQLLVREDRILLLAFDEFEKLEEGGQRNYINLPLLLDWFRSVIQNRPRIALLFCGVKTINDAGMRWGGYFVNVETLKVSFLQPEEARRLITRPVAHFPGDDIFHQEVVDYIIQITGCHPFLIQAICSSIISSLNHETRSTASIEDVRMAIEDVFDKWEDNYFSDMWERTDHEQRACLRALLQLEQGNLDQVCCVCGMEAVIVRRALQKLFRRDIVTRVQDSYRIAAPIFVEWVRRNV